MKIRGTTICFKSKPEFFKKELSGIKPNTVRDLSLTEVLPLCLPCNDFKELVSHIQIVNSETGEFFVRELSDITYYDDRFIFSWKHPVTPREALDEIDDCFPIAEYLREAGYRVEE